ncbi:hypothetical protein HII31_12217 [Pseudocercospora fuligena]|uniref:Cell wall protein n=1 Tax=Pseudocercospora fuligena TaxID=685502 RepID=A0A8H6R5R1_9PEZI|nr:hypothetical protein HII31_12217 [Pseudocercospora fuligena]
MHFTSAIAAAILAFSATGVLAAPVPQLAGEGAACNSVLSQTDNGVGYGVENAEDNTASTISKTGAKFLRRQLAGEGAACDSVLSQTDNGVGYGVENAEDNTAKTISSTGLRYRQLDKISSGAQAISQAAGTGASTSAVTTELDNIDGESTGGAADLGAKIGDTEAGTLEGAGAAIPKARRQLDKISNGAQAISNAAKTGSLTSPATNGLDGIDGTSTGAAADLGAEVGGAEAGTLEAVGSSVP